MPGTVDLVKKDQRAYVFLNNPEKRNAISVNMWERLKAVAVELSNDVTIRCVVVRGYGMSAFAAGADISQFESKRTPTSTGSSYDDLTEGAVAAIRAIPAPVIALIHGFCIGGGISLALACDLRFASNDSSFSIPAAKLGTAYPPPATNRLTAQIGISNAKFLLFSAKRIGAEMAKEMHLVDRVCKQEELDEEVESFISSLAENAPLSIRAAKTVIDQLALPEGERDNAEISRVSKACFESKDYLEGVRAFSESRKARFDGI